MDSMQLTDDEQRASRAPTRRSYQSPRLSVLGDVCSLTETGSMMSNESPLNWCLIDINMAGNTCRP